MISIIVCSICQKNFIRLSDSIQEKIGIPFQLIRIENNIEKLSISEAYNKGADQAVYDFLCFIHEDVVFHTNQWGEALVKAFKGLPNPGVLGVAGSNYLPISPSYWWIPDPKRRFCNYLDNHETGNIGEGKLRFSGHTDPVQVYLLDGMFLAIKKEVFKKVKFDESLEGFHGYDTSICLRSAIEFQNYFIPNILIEHFSQGKPNVTWLLNTVNSYSQKERIPFQGKIDGNLEVKSFHLFLNHLRKFGPSLSFQRKHSMIYLKKLNTKLLSFQAWYIWLWFQLRFIKSALTR
jgi:glycosyltransferase involved in cell wall biosynthesis